MEGCDRETNKPQARKEMGSSLCDTEKNCLSSTNYKKNCK